MNTEPFSPLFNNEEQCIQSHECHVRKEVFLLFLWLNIKIVMGHSSQHLAFQIAFILQWQEFQTSTSFDSMACYRIKALVHAHEHEHENNE